MDEVGYGTRFHSTIVGGSNVRVGPSSSSSLWARDWGNGLSTECVTGGLSSRFARNEGSVAGDDAGDDGRGMCRHSICRLQTTNSPESVRKTAELGRKFTMKVRRLHEVHQPSMRVRFRLAVGRKDRPTCTMRIAVFSPLS